MSKPTKPTKPTKLTSAKKIKVTGRVKNGKLEIDSNSLAKFCNGLPKSNVSFIALNAPFKTKQDLTGSS